MSQLHGSEAEGPKQTRIGIRFGPFASLPCSCNIITGKVYFVYAMAKLTNLGFNLHCFSNIDSWAEISALGKLEIAHAISS